MTFNNQTLTIKIQKAISSLKNGHPILINNTLFFSSETIDKLQLQTLKHYSQHHTIEYHKYHSTIQTTDKLADAANKLCLYSELLPSSISTEYNQQIVDKFLPISLTIDEIESFDYFSCYDLEYNCHAKVPTEACEDVTLYAFRSAMTGSTHYAIVIKNPTSLVRIHSSCYTGDLMFSLRCDCKYQLHNAIKFISNSGGGMIIYLSQEGRGIGLASKIKTYSLQQGNGLNTIDSNLCLGFENDYRNFYPAKKILDYFKINEISLITNNPQKSKDIAGHGVTVTSTVNIPSVQNKHNQEYLKTKQNILGHS